MSGPTLAAHSKSSDEMPTITGSMLLLRADSEEDVMQMVRENPYSKVGVWDLDKVVVTPFKCAVRTAL